MEIVIGWIAQWFGYKKYYEKYKDYVQLTTPIKSELAYK
jgi:hypothetical protein